MLLIDKLIEKIKVVIRKYIVFGYQETQTLTTVYVIFVAHARNIGGTGSSENASTRRKDDLDLDRCPVAGSYDSTTELNIKQKR